MIPKFRIHDYLHACFCLQLIKVFTKRIVAVESQQINEEPAGRTSITNKRGRTKRGRKGGGGATPSLAALSIGE